ncbi:hypothetical protein AB0N23_28650 [Streptomyces sp. NPDC052644]
MGVPVEDDGVRSRFDGRPRAQMVVGHTGDEALSRSDRMGHALGYRHHAVFGLGTRGVLLVYRRDEASYARRRAETTVARLRSGGPLFPDLEAPPPRRRRPHSPRPGAAPHQGAIPAAARPATTPGPVRRSTAPGSGDPPPELSAL